MPLQDNPIDYRTSSLPRIQIASNSNYSFNALGQDNFEVLAIG